MNKKDEKANILVMGNSGVGKSTLINSVFDFAQAPVGNGTAVTKKMTVYENDQLNFRVIDSKGIEYGLSAQLQTKREIIKWSKTSVKKRKEDQYIHIIWYCVDATSKRFFDKNLDVVRKIAKLWKKVPIVIVLTKSYSETEMDENVQMIKSRLAMYKDIKDLNVIDIIPVVAQEFPINAETIVTPVGVSKLVERTIEIIPDSFILTKEAVNDLDLRIKRTEATALVAASTASAGAVGAIPLPVADSLILTPLQVGMIKGIMKIYDFKRGDNSSSIIEALIGGGTIAAAAKMIVSALKAIPGINIAAAAINIIVASVITAILGEVIITFMDKIAKGELDPDDLEWMKKYAESKFGKEVGTYIEKISQSLDSKDAKDIGKVISNIFKEINFRK